MTPSDWHVLHDELAKCPWFTRVGEKKESDGSPFVRCVSSWTEAVWWADAEISWWCVNEASNVLREFLHGNYNREYQEWNNHIASFGPSLNELIAGPVSAALPPEVRNPGVIEWIRSHLTRAYLECVYSTMSDVRLVCNQVDWYLAGYFPCGWFVEEETAFPHRAMTVVF